MNFKIVFGELLAQVALAELQHDETLACVWENVDHSDDVLRMQLTQALLFTQLQLFHLLYRNRLACGLYFSFPHSRVSPMTQLPPQY